MTARAQALDQNQAARGSEMTIAGVAMFADFSGALFWEEQSLLVISDLHLEKGSSFAARGVLLPPYDTAATLGRLAAVIARHDPRRVIALGDSFHDREAHTRLSAADRNALVNGLNGGTETRASVLRKVVDTSVNIRVFLHQVLGTAIDHDLGHL